MTGNRSCPVDVRQLGPADLKRLFDSSFCAMSYGLPEDRAPWGISRFQNVRLDAVSVFFDEGYGRRTVVRTRQHILSDAAANFIVVTPLRHHSRMAQDGLWRDCAPGSFRVLSTAVPFCGHVQGRDTRDRYAELLATIPGLQAMNRATHPDSAFGCACQTNHGLEHRMERREPAFG